MKRGDVVLVNVPYVGLSGAKVRPALVIQNDSLNNTNSCLKAALAIP
jgi:mRNA-degrading endonuclease toxin of MazEF toxin-antitoxin module